jgi:hypothetical protein
MADPIELIDILEEKIKDLESKYIDSEYWYEIFPKEQKEIIKQLKEENAATELCLKLAAYRDNRHTESKITCRI